MLNERIGPETARFAVLGQSLPHTWSPYIHNSLFDAAGLDAVYLPVTVPPERLGSVTDVFRSCFSGFNVTIPYKEKILPFLDDVDEAAQVCGAVNTVEIRNGRMIGHITDGLGMLRAIEERGVETHQADVLILGGGGAARVAGYAFLSRGGRVTFAVRDTVFEDKEIKEGDIIGIHNGRIEVVGKSIHDIALELVKHVVEDGDSLITIYYGQDTKQEDADALGAEVAEMFSDLDVEVQYGGQPLYYYLISAE